jgi:hypothetical protein
MDSGGQGTSCYLIPLTKATKSQDGLSRGYVFEGPCRTPGGTLVQVKIRAQFSWHVTIGKAEEIVEAFVPSPGGANGKILTKATGCKSDPFIVGAGACTGESFVNTQGVPISFGEIHLGTPPLMWGRVPTNQVYETPPPKPPPLAGQVVFMKPTEGQQVPVGGTFEVRFSPAEPQYPPAGGVRVEWVHAPTGQCKADASIEGNSVDHYSMGMMVRLTELGTYCLRGMSKVGVYTQWRRITVFKPVLGIAPGGGTQMEAKASQKPPDRLPPTEINLAASQLTSLEGRLQRQGSNPEATRLLTEIRAYRARLGQEPNDVAALQKRLRELTAQVDGLEVALKKGTSGPTLGAGSELAPTVKPKATSP